jgi:hypothetical protein
MTKRDLEIIEHAINVSHTHGGSINLHKAFQFVHGLFSKKKSKPKESEPIYYGYDPKSTKAPPHESTYTKKPEEPKKAPKYYEEQPKQEYTKPKQEPKREYKQSYPEPPHQNPKRATNHKHEHHYATLGLTSDASPEEVKKAYRRLSLLHHPDKNVGNEQQAEEEFKKVNNAYSTIVGKGIKKRKYVRKHK